MSDFLKKTFSNSIAVFLLTIFFCLSFTDKVLAQSAEQYIRQGDKSYIEADYYTAFYYFNQAKQIDSFSLEAYYKMAESSRKFNDYKGANKLYERVLLIDKYKEYPLSEFWMGMMEKFLGNYEKSKEYYNRFVNRYSFQDYYKKKAMQELASAAWIKEHSDIDKNAMIQRMGNEINTQFSEFAASEMNDSFYQFSSIREQPSSLQKNNKEFLSRIYTMKLDNNVWKENKELFTWLNSFEQHIANGSFSEDGQRFYFNVCENKNVSELRCDIYLSSMIDGKWQAPVKLNDLINPKDATNTQPYEAENKVLYFVSDRKGGEGKLDIWYVNRNKANEFSSPINIGDQINSPDDDISPSYDAKSRKFYFSSEWYYGYGGFDIFFAKKQKGVFVFDEPENVGLPINSSCNDIYFNYNPLKQEGYLASNRKGSLSLKGESCCNDIYKLKYLSTTNSKDTNVVALTKIIGKDTTLLSSTSKVPSIDTIIKSPNLVLEKLKSFLPVTVYFHNDIPNPRSELDTTILNYKTTYDDYTLMKSEYKNEYKKISGLAESDIEISSLFDNKIDEGYRKLLQFTTLLKQQMLENKTVSLTIEGYCSPLALNNYNIHLANRRIASLKNYIYEFDNGFFQSYLSSNKLIYKNAPFGEEKADQKISDDRLDLPHSVYQPKAALERRVAIIGIE